jgi:hypothetical protein
MLTGENLPLDLFAVLLTPKFETTAHALFSGNNSGCLNCTTWCQTSIRFALNYSVSLLICLSLFWQRSFRLKEETRKVLAAQDGQNALLKHRKLPASRPDMQVRTQPEYKSARNKNNRVDTVARGLEFPQKSECIHVSKLLNLSTPPLPLHPFSHFVAISRTFSPSALYPFANPSHQLQMALFARDPTRERENSVSDFTIKQQQKVLESAGQHERHSVCGWHAYRFFYSVRII